LRIDKPDGEHGKKPIDFEYTYYRAAELPEVASLEIERSD